MTAPLIQASTETAPEVIRAARVQNLADFLELFGVASDLLVVELRESFGALIDDRNSPEEARLLDRLERVSKLLNIGFLCGALADDGRLNSVLDKLWRLKRGDNLQSSRNRSPLMAHFNWGPRDPRGYAGTWFSRLVALETRLRQQDIQGLLASLRADLENFENLDLKGLMLNFAVSSEENLIDACAWNEEPSETQTSLAELEQFLFITLDLRNLLDSAPPMVWGLTLDVYRAHYQPKQLHIVMDSVRSTYAGVERDPDTVPEIVAYETVKVWSLAWAHLEGGAAGSKSEVEVDVQAIMTSNS